MADVVVTPTTLSKWPMMFIIQTLVCLLFLATLLINIPKAENILWG